MIPFNMKHLYLGGSGQECILHSKETIGLPINSDQSSGKLHLILELIGIVSYFLAVELNRDFNITKGCQIPSKQVCDVIVRSFHNEFN